MFEKLKKYYKEIEDISIRFIKEADAFKLRVVFKNGYCKVFLIDPAGIDLDIAIAENIEGAVELMNRERIILDRLKEEIM